MIRRLLKVFCTTVLPGQFSHIRFDIMEHTCRIQFEHSFINLKLEIQNWCFTRAYFLRMKHNFIYPSKKTIQPRNKSISNSNQPMAICKSKSDIGKNIPKLQAMCRILANTFHVSNNNTNGRHKIKQRNLNRSQLVHQKTLLRMVY